MNSTKSKKISLCETSVIRKNTRIHNACKKVETKIKDKAFRRKIIISAVIFLLFNLVIILMLAKKTIVYKLTKYFAKKILEGADPKEKELISQIQKNLPVVVDFVNTHADSIKKANDNYTYYSNMYKDFVKSVSVEGEYQKDIVLPGSFPTTQDELPPLPTKKLDETEAKELIDDLVEKTPKYPFVLLNII